MKLTQGLSPWVVAFMAAVVVITAIAGQSLHGSAATAGGEYSVVFLVFLYLNLILVLALIALVSRQLTRLWSERRRRLAGSQLRFRMVTLFVALSLLPSLVIAILSVELLNQGVDSWFSDRISRALNLSLEVARAYYRENQRTVRHDAEDIVRNRTITTGLALQGGEGAIAALEVERKARGLDEIAIFHADGTRIANAGELPFDPMPDLTTLTEESTKALLVTNDTGHRVRAFVKLGSGLILSTGRWIDRQVQAQMESIEAAYVDYHHLRAAHGLLKQNHTVILLMVTLVLMLAAIWSGFRIADGITDPITELVIGTRKVAAGDLAVTLSVSGDDELATLMAAFNAMTLKLTENRDELQANYALLEERRRFMEAIVGNISSGVISVNRHGTITLMNPVAGRLLGVDPFSAIGGRFRDTLPEPVLTPLCNLLPDEGNRPPPIPPAAAPHDHAPLTVQMQLPGSDKLLILLARVTVLEDHHGSSQGFIATFDDITEVVTAQRTRAWSEVARRIAHEIKNPLTPIQLWAQRIRRRYLRQVALDDQWRVLDEGTHTIINQVEELRVLVNEFSTFARLPRPVLTMDQLNPAVLEVVTLHKAAMKEVKLLLGLSDGLPLFPFDRGQIKQVLTNLITNALAVLGQAREEGGGGGGGKGIVAIDTEVAENGQWILLTVADNGPGIPPADRDRVFEPYFTTKLKGTGLGLAIVKKIIEDHGAMIRIRDSQWGGALIELQFPVHGAIHSPLPLVAST